MFPDPVTGVAYASEFELRAVQARRQLLYDQLQISSERKAEAEAIRQKELDGLWTGLEVPSSVLVSERVSRLITPEAATPRGTVRLDGLLESRIGRRGRVRFHFLLGGKAMPQYQQTMDIDVRDLDRLGHPFSWWDPKQMVRTAVIRSKRHDRNDQWKPSRIRYWED